MASGGAASASLCSSTPARAPTLLSRTSARQGGRAFVASEALAVPTVWNVCNTSLVRCVRTVALTSPFSAANPAPRAAGLTPADDPHVRRQFWWQRHPYAAPRPFGWLWPLGGGGGAIQNESRATPRERRERARAVTRLEHSYSVAVGRVLSPRGGFVEGCARCAHEAAIYAPPTPHHSTPGAALLVDWRAGVVADPPARAPRRARAAYYALATRAPLLSFARLLVLAQRFSSDYGHFLTELLPRLVVARAEILADPQMHLFVDCSARFVRPWLRFFLGDVSARLVCSEARRLVHADCLAFARFATPFTSGWRLGLERVRAAAHRQAGVAHAHSPAHRQAGVADARASRLAVWADRDLSARGGGTVNRVRHVPRAQQILAALRARLPDYRLVDFRGSKFSPAQTVQLFSAASLVLGPSGSAMHNVLFCRPGALVVEILPADLSYAAIWQDAVLLGLHYRAFHLPGFTCATNATFSDAEIQRLASGISACLAGIEGATPLIEAAKVDGQKHHRLQGTTPHLKKRALRRRRFDGNPVVV